MVRKRYQKVTREYCNQAIDLLIAYFIKLAERSPSDTASTQQHISGSSSPIIINGFYSLLFNRLLHFTEIHQTYQIWCAYCECIEGP